MVPDLKAYDFASAYMTLASLEEAMAHVDGWFSNSTLCTR
jgi:hypothetical protein